MSEPDASWPQISSALFYDDAGRAIDWLCEAFGFEPRLRIDGEGGRVEHSELVLEDGLIMVASAGPAPGGPPETELCRSPRSLGGANTQWLVVRVDDLDAHCERARKAGARILQEPRTDDYGEEHGAHRTYRAADTEDHRWCFMARVGAPRPGGR